jgi:hypothetical protein
MSDTLLTIALAATRRWLDLYTRGLPGRVAEERRAEVESDVWEMLHDAEFTQRADLAREAVSRLIRGVPSDIGWRMDNADGREQFWTRRCIALAAATIVALSVWAVPSLLLKGRREVVSCADAASTPTTTAALRHDVIRCAGAFFTARDDRER